jgi:hypothetical protein
MPLKPSTAAIKAMMKNVTAHPIMTNLPVCLRLSPAVPSRRTGSKLLTAHGGPDPM